MNTYNVTNSNDFGTGSLRNAINQANANPGKDEIIIDVERINLESEIQISESLDIQGNGAMITQTGTDSILYIDDLDDDLNQDVSLNNLTLTGANSIFMGGAIQAWENIVLDTVTVKDNKGTGFGGGLYATGGSVVIKDSLFEGNEVLTDEFGDHNGGALFIEFGTTVGIDNSIFRENVSPKHAIGLVSVTAIITDTEIVNNSSTGLVTSGTVLDANNILVDSNDSTGIAALSGSSWIIESSTVSKRPLA